MDLNNEKLNFFDNAVYLKINKIPREEDLEIINLYFQANNYSGGDDIIESNYDNEKNILKLTYLNHKNKQEILRRKVFKYKSYEFEACEALKKQNLHINLVKLQRVLIFENFDRTETFDDIGIYVNCIAKNNIISKIEYSNIYDNITYIVFQNEIQNFEEIKKNLEKKPTFRNKSVQIYEAFETNSILVKLNCLNENKID